MYLLPVQYNYTATTENAKCLLITQFSGQGFSDNPVSSPEFCGYVSSSLSRSKEPLLQSTKKKSKKLEIQCILCYSWYIVLHFQQLQFVSLIDQYSTFYENKKESLDQQRLLSSVIDKEEKYTWKLLSESTQQKVKYTVRENNMKITISFC